MVTEFDTASLPLLNNSPHKRRDVACSVRVTLRAALA